MRPCEMHAYEVHARRPYNVQAFEVRLRPRLRVPESWQQKRPEICSELTFHSPTRRRFYQ
jgi:hypothetical protein